MILAGDEFGHTQQGNNNAYCQDSEISWLNWNLTDDQRLLLEFTRKVIHLKHKHPVLRRRTFLQGRALRGSEIKDITWLIPSGVEMTDADWNAGFLRAFSVLLAGDAIAETNSHGEVVVDDTLLLFFNAHHEGMKFTIPKKPNRDDWQVILDTAVNEPVAKILASGAQYEVQPRSIVLLSHPATPSFDQSPVEAPPAVLPAPPVQ
jgi:glycogen operon protein